MRKISISIVVFDTPPREIECCIRSLLGAIEYYSSTTHSFSEVQIFIVNNGEQDLTSILELLTDSEDFRELAFKFELIEGHGNIGYGAAQNLALKDTNALFHLIMNPDVLVSKDALYEGIRFLESNPDVAIVSPNAADKDSAKQYLCKQYPTVFSLILRGIMPEFICTLFRDNLNCYEMRQLPEDQPSVEIPLVSGCFMLGKTRALKSVNGFDDSYFLYFEDFDLSIRLSEDYKLAYLPSMKIIHYGGSAGRKGFRHIFMFLSSAFRFFNSYGWR